MSAPLGASDAAERGARALAEGRVAEAVTTLRAAVAAGPEDPGSRANLAQALRAHGDREEALAHALIALRAAPERPALHRLVAGLLLLLGDAEGAIARWRASLELGGGRLSRFQVGVALRAAGDPSAVAHLRAALAPSPEPELPPLLRARAEGALADAERGPGRPLDLCSVPQVTEVFGLASPAPGPPSPAPTRSPQVVTPEGIARGWGHPRVVALTGAGISRASGLATRKELWRRFARDEAVSVWRFRERPSELWRVIADFLADGEPAPSAAHLALARLPGLAAVLTQNVDGLHQAAAAQAGTPAEVVELHGTLGVTRCHDCGLRGPPAWTWLAAGAELPPRCACGGVVRPDVVLFGEPVAPDRLGRAQALVAGCDVLLVVGCAMDVAPASELPRLAAARGARVIEVKRRPSRLSDALGTELLAGPAEEILPCLVEALDAR